ncbi:hypothetical protein FH972_021195 [Carpinus fangiana]|uniref:Major facilitator superfamily (MFS) profile domain-containing protein n=1 Tax=Carpinus fangiana TaxID=176857 RepID=A0A5N6KQT1_9ROSI|nr:hypothetical protein FH972_021195 [Carpinus fangiana]
MTTDSKSGRLAGDLVQYTDPEKSTDATEHMNVLSHDAAAAAAAASIPTTDGRPSRFAHLDEKKILRKMDLHILPTLSLLYLLSFLDRGNIGNAKIEGLDIDLNLSGPEYNWCLTAFFFTYCAFEVPSNMMLKKLRPSIWLPAIMVAWGLVMTLMGLVQNYAGLLTARIFLGVAEAGLFPGVAYYLTMWYCRHEMQLRQALFFSAASIAGAFSGLLAYGIGFMNGVGGLEGWRWIFILEGIVTVLVALGAFFCVYDFPDTARFLSKEERDFVVWRLRRDGDDAGGLVGGELGERGVGVEQSDAQFSWRDTKAAFMDWQPWLNIVVYWGYVCPLYGISLFLPTIIKGLGYESATAQLLTVPIYVAASIFAVGIAFFADRYKRRSPFVLALLFVCLIGFAMCLGTDKPGVVYAGVFIAACAIYPTQPANVSWLANNLAGGYKRAVGMGIQISVGNMAGAMASNFYRKQDMPMYRLGHGLEVGFICAGIVAASIQTLAYRRINRKRDEAVARGEHRAFSMEELILHSAQLAASAIAAQATLHLRDKSFLEDKTLFPSSRLAGWAASAQRRGRMPETGQTLGLHMPAFRLGVRVTVVNPAAEVTQTRLSEQTPPTSVSASRRTCDNRRAVNSSTSLRIPWDPFPCWLGALGQDGRWSGPSQKMAAAHGGHAACAAYLAVPLHSAGAGIHAVIRGLATEELTTHGAAMTPDTAPQLQRVPCRNMHPVWQSQTLPYFQGQVASASASTARHARQEDEPRAIRRILRDSKRHRPVRLSQGRRFKRGEALSGDGFISVAVAEWRAPS